MTSGNIRDKARKQRAGDRVGAWYEGGRVIVFNWDKSPSHSQILLAKKGGSFLGVYDRKIQRGWLEEDIRAVEDRFRSHPAVRTTL